MSSSAGFGGNFPFPANQGGNRGAQQIPPQTQQPVIQPPTAQQLAQQQHHHHAAEGKAEGSPAAAAAAAAAGGEHHEGEGAASAEGEIDEVVVRLLVPNSLVGSIIGKAGSTIKDLTAQTGAKIHIAQNDDAYERTITISGPVVNVANAQLQITSKIHEDSYAEVKEVESALPVEQRISLIPIKFLVPNAVVGRLIGKGGATLKKTMAETNSFISCAKDDETNRYALERIVSIVGNLHDQNKALSALAIQVHRAQVHNPEQVTYDVNVNSTAATRSQPFIPGYQGGGGRQGGRGGPVRPSQEIQDHEEGVTLYVPNSVVGSIIGKGGATVKEIGQRSKTQIRVVRSEELEPNAAFRPITIAGPIEAIFKAEALLFAKVAEAPPAMGGTHELRVELVIPNDTVGRVIGKKGAQVKKINEVSGARVTVSQDEEVDEASGTIVTIIGGLDANLTAQNRVFEIVYYQPTAEHEQ